LFAGYQQALEQLAQGATVEPILRRFEWQLLDILGYGFSLTEDANGRPIDAPQRYVWHATDGLQPLSAPLLGDGGLPGSALLAMAADDWQQTTTLSPPIRRKRQAPRAHVGPRPLAARHPCIGRSPPLDGDQQRLRRHASCLLAIPPPWLPRVRPAAPGIRRRSRRPSGRSGRGRT